MLRPQKTGGLQNAGGPQKLFRSIFFDKTDLYPPCAPQRGAEPPGEGRRQVPPQAEAPVALPDGRRIHARLSPQQQKILRGQDGEICRARPAEGAERLRRALPPDDAPFHPFLLHRRAQACLDADKFVRGEALHEPERRVVVVRARIADAVDGNVVREIGVVGVAVKGELQNFHPREAGAAQKTQHAPVHLPEVLRDEGEFAERAFGRGKQLHARAAPPAAVLGRRGARLHLVIAVQPAEMVDADDVVQREGSADAADPPGVPFRRVRLPVVDGVAPKLAGRRKIIGRDARHPPRGAVFVEFEQVRIRPHVRRIGRDVEGDVADEADAQPVDIGAQILPLAAEFVLQEQPEEIFTAVFGQKAFEGGGIAQAVFLLPAVEARPAVRLFERHEQGILVKFSPLDERRKGGIAHIEPRKGAAQHGEFDVVQEAVIDVPDAAQGAHLGGAEQPLRDEALHVEQVRVARSAEHRLIGRIAVPRLHEGQHLPVAHAGGVQEVGKAPRALAQRADAVPARQRGDVQQHPRRTLRDGRVGNFFPAFLCLSANSHLSLSKETAPFPAPSPLFYHRKRGLSRFF